MPLLSATPLDAKITAFWHQKAVQLDGFSIISPLVRMKGLEPSRPRALAPKVSDSVASSLSISRCLRI